MRESPRRGSQRIPVGKLHANSWNPNVVPEHIQAALGKNIERAGFNQPLLVRPHPTLTGEYEIIDGEHRWKLARDSGSKDVEAIVRDFSDVEARAQTLAMNKLRGEMDSTDVLTLIREIEGDGLDLDELLSFSGYTMPDLDEMIAEFDLAELLRRQEENPRDPDAVPPIPDEPEAKVGDVYELGPHRLMCGDTTNAGNMVALMCGDLASVVFTDPPYGVEYRGGMKPREALRNDGRGTAIYDESLPLMVLHSQKRAAFYVWYADLSIAAAAAAAAAGLAVRCQIVWVKNNAQFASSAHYHGKHEPMIYASRAGETPAWYGPTNEVTVWEYDRASSNDFHPTQKPVPICERALRNSSRTGEIVLDPFAGSGSTLIAAERTGRRAFLMEIEPRYVDVIRKRYEEYVGG